MKCRDKEYVIGHLKAVAAAVLTPYRQQSVATTVAVSRIKCLQCEYQ